MNTDIYLTISSFSEGLYKNKGSKFIAYAFPIATEEEAKLHISQIKKDHFSAKHHCYAYVIGKQIQRANDDGEPTYTAGKPILTQILSYNVTNVLIIVVRYFGGTLLGTGGLIEAYRSAAADALKNANIIEKTIDTIYQIQFGFADMNDVMKLIKEEKLQEISRNFESIACITFAVRKSNEIKVLAKLNKIESVQVKPLNT